MSGSISRLESEWLKDAARLSASKAAPILQDVLTRHAEPHRRYHGANHLVALFDLLAHHAPHIVRGSAPRLAIWWHDAIYDPQAHDNEARSADLAYSHLLQLGAPATLIEETVRLIHQTTNHWSGGLYGDGDYFLDADIAVLGAPPEVYDQYAAGVRHEYAWAPDDAYRAGRSTFLVGALDRPRLFRTDAFETAYAEQARINMRRELTTLTGTSR
ncbi:MAG: hypothetical protein R3C46_00290 [Hyphomonadaceae bacterium]